MSDNKIELKEALKKYPEFLHILLDIDKEFLEEFIEKDYKILKYFIDFLQKEMVITCYIQKDDISTIELINFDRINKKWKKLRMEEKNKWINGEDY